MKLGISSYTFGWAVGVRGHTPAHPLDELGLLDKARELDVKLLQIGDNLPLHQFTEARLHRLADRAKSEGVQLEVGARRLIRERIAGYVRLARVLDARLIRFVVDDADFHPEPREIIALLRECIPLLDGRTLGIENHDRFSAQALREIIEEVGSDQVGVCLDTANSLGAGEGIEQVASVLAPHVVNLHIKDFRADRLPHQMGFTVIGQPAGRGFLNLSRLLEQLTAARHCQTAVLELWTPPEPQLDQTITKEASWAVQSIEFLKPFFR